METRNGTYPPDEVDRVKPALALLLRVGRMCRDNIICRQLWLHLEVRKLTIFESHELDVRLGQIDLPAEVEVSEARRDLAAVSCAQH